MKQIKLINSDLFTIIDDEDYLKVCRYKWRYFQFKTRTPYITAYIKEYRQNIFLHRFIMNLKSGDKNQVDHKNRNTLDNRKENLRLADIFLNNINKGILKNNTSGYKGVSWHKYNQKWYAQTSFHNKRIHLGYFNSAREAALAYNKKAKELFGEYAYLNKIRERPVKI